MHKFSKTMKIIRSILLLAVGFGTLPAQAQLTIDACQQKAQANYPLVAQYGLIRQSEQYDLENANKGYLPQLSLSAKASYQTDVTKIPFSLPGIDIPTLSKDQYQIVAEVNQVIWDGGNIRAKKQNVKASAEVDLQQQQVDMYAIRERVNSLFFGILLTEEQLELNRLYDEELERNYRKISSFIENGVANQADLDAVQVEQFSNRQQRVSLEATNRAYRQMLGAFIGENADSAELICPEVGSEPAPTDVNRPELRLLDARNTLLDAQLKQLNARNRPTLGLFVQGAYGKPGLNMLQDKFKAFAIGGVRFSWNFGNYYTHTTRNVPVQYEPAGRILAKRTRKIPPHALRRRPDRSAARQYQTRVGGEGRGGHDERYRLHAGSNQSRNGAAEPRTAPDATDHDDIQPEKYNQQLI